MNNIIKVLKRYSIDRPINSVNLAKEIGVEPGYNGADSIQLRQAINRLREAGHPIIANYKGYFYAKTKQQVRDYVQWRRARIQKDIEATDIVEKTIKNLKK